MQSIQEASAAFLASKRVAVTRVSRTPRNHGSNNVYRRLRQRGYQVFAVNPNTDVVEGDRTYQDLKSIPGGVDAVMIGTRPESRRTAGSEIAATSGRWVKLTKECAQLVRKYGLRKSSKTSLSTGVVNGSKGQIGGFVSFAVRTTAPRASAGGCSPMECLHVEADDRRRRYAGAQKAMPPRVKPGGPWV